MSEVTLHIFILFASVFISAFSQILLKKAALRHYPSVIREYLNLFVITAYGIYFVAVVLDLLALRRVPVSYVPAIEASSYIFIIVLSRIFLKERLSRRKLMAISIIFAGIVIYLI